MKSNANAMILVAMILVAAFAFNAGLMWVAVNLLGWNPIIIAGLFGAGHAANHLFRTKDSR
jgi:fatty acid desaturase